MHLLATNIAEVVLLVFGLAFQDDSMQLSLSPRHLARSDFPLSLGERVPTFTACRPLDQHAYGWTTRVWIGR